VRDKATENSKESAVVFLKPLAGRKRKDEEND